MQRPRADEPLRLLAVHAHPDDESSKGAASTAMYVDRGVEVLVATCTGGERGSVLNPTADLAGREIAEVRRDEMAAAAAALGVSHRWLGFIDSGCPEGDPLPPLPDDCFAALPLEVAAQPVVELVRRYRPHVITTYDENGGYPHPDHIRAHEVSRLAWERAADQDVDTGQAPWSAAKLYYHHTFSRTRVLALHEAVLDSGTVSGYAEWLEDWDEADDSFHRVTTRVHCASHFDRRDAALRAHATQIDPASAWFSVPRELESRVWPTEDFELADSRVGHATAEDDLFARVRET